jgi:hypothetical protein
MGAEQQPDPRLLENAGPKRALHFPDERFRTAVETAVCLVLLEPDWRCRFDVCPGFGRSKALVVVSDFLAVVGSSHEFDTESIFILPCILKCVGDMG